MMPDLERLAELLDAARDLNDPGHVNDEYARGQMNLICDSAGLPTDDYGGLVTAVITHRESTQAAVTRIAGLDAATASCTLCWG